MNSPRLCLGVNNFDALKRRRCIKNPVSDPLGRKKFGGSPDGLPRGSQNLDFFSMQMKKLIVLLIGIFIISCKHESKVDHILFSGFIANLDAKSIQVSGYSFNKEIELKDGIFSDTLMIKEEGYHDLKIGTEKLALYLSKSDNLNLNINTKKFNESIKYTGKGGEKNNLLAQKYMISKKLTEDTKTFYSQTEDDFVAIAKEVRTKTESAINFADLSSTFRQQQLNDAKYAFIFAINNYERYHAYYSKNEDFKVSDTYKNNIIGVTHDNVDAYKSSDAYRSLVSSKYQKIITELYSESGDYGTAIVSALKSVENGHIKDELLKRFAYYTLSPTENLQSTYDYFMANTANEDYKKSFTEKYNKLKIIAVGAPSPIFVNYENHKGGKTSLADLKGRYVYVDVWATWCGPCIAEIPALKEVEKEYHNKNIEFVSISVDTEKYYDKWKKMVSDKKLAGIQLIADKNGESKFITDYVIENIPRFILIDPEGNIVNADAPQPSSPKLIDIFNELKI